jgi:hypothetical protein
VYAINFRCRGVSTELLIGERKRRDEQQFQRRTAERAAERGERFRDRERFPRGKNPRRAGEIKTPERALHAQRAYKYSVTIPTPARSRIDSPIKCK